jgi:hypothetical protein
MINHGTNFRSARQFAPPADPTALPADAALARGVERLQALAQGELFAGDMRGLAASRRGWKFGSSALADVWVPQTAHD